MWAGSVGMTEKGDCDLSVVIVKTGGGGLLDLMEWSGGFFLGGEGLFFSPALFCSSPLLRFASSDQNSRNL